MTDQAQPAADGAPPLPARLVPLGQLVANRFNPRRDYDEAALTELVSSMREHGFVGALDGRELPGGRIEVAYGSRRLRAAAAAGIAAIPVIVHEWDDDHMRFVALVENLARADLSPLEQAAAVGELHAGAGLSVRDLAARLGKPVTWVQDCLSLYQAPDDVRDMVLARPDSLRHARHLARLEEAPARTMLEELVLAEAITAAQVHEAVRALLAGVPLVEALDQLGLDVGDEAAEPVERRGPQDGRRLADREEATALPPSRRRTRAATDPSPALARIRRSLALLRPDSLPAAALPPLLAELDALIERATALRREIGGRCEQEQPPG